MQSFKKIKFHKRTVIKINSDYFIDLSNSNDSIKLSGKKYYRINKKDLVKYGIEKERRKVNSTGNRTCWKPKKSGEAIITIPGIGGFQYSKAA